MKSAVLGRIGLVVATRRPLAPRWRWARLGVVGLCLLALAGMPQLVHAQAEPASKNRAAAAWQQLRVEASRKLQSADDRLEAFEEVLDDLEVFARDHEGTQEAVLALVSHGMLSAQLGDREAAGRSLEQALEDADDEQ